jgi:hypothetical protein
MHKLIAIAVILMSTAAFGQDASCIRLFDHGYKDIILCRASVGNATTYTKQVTSDDAASIETITPETYISLLKADSDHTVYQSTPKPIAGGTLDDVKPVMPHLAAGSIHKKKDCIKAGYNWKSGVCEAK